MSYCLLSLTSPPDPCVSAPCLNSGVCLPEADGSAYSCVCQSGFTDENCQTPGEINTNST